jgi:hypothetical protein
MTKRNAANLVSGANPRPEGANKLIVAAVVGLVGLAGCAVPAGGQSARIPLRGQQAIVQIEGQGTVEGPGLECRATSGAECTAAYDELATASLTAHAAPGWKFERWEWQPVDAAIAPSFEGAQKHRYTAVFAPANAQISRR